MNPRPADPAPLEELTALRRRTFYPKTDLPAALEEIRSRLAARESEMQRLAGSVRTAAERALQARIDSIEALSRAGTFRLVYLLRLADGAHAIFRAGCMSPDRPAFEFLIEERLGAILSRASVPHPVTLATDLTRRDFPLDFQITRRVEGSALSEIQNPDTQFIPDEILENLGRIFAQLHTVPATGAGLLDPAALTATAPRLEGVLNAWPEYILCNLPDHLRVCVAILAISREEAVIIERLFGEAVAELKSRPIRLLHGDPALHNTFVHAGRVTALIDWEDALAGDPLFELAYWGTFVRDYLREPFLRGYRAAAGLPERWEYFYWLYYLRIALSKTVHRHRFQHPDIAGRPPASLRIQKALHHLEACAG